MLARVAGVCPYFYVEAPDEFSEDHLQQFLDYLNVLVLSFISQANRLILFILSRVKKSRER